MTALTTSADASTNKPISTNTSALPEVRPIPELGRSSRLSANMRSTLHCRLKPIVCRRFGRIEPTALGADAATVSFDLIAQFSANPGQDVHRRPRQLPDLGLPAQARCRRGALVAGPTTAAPRRSGSPGWHKVCLHAINTGTGASCLLGSPCDQTCTDRNSPPGRLGWISSP